MRPLHLTIEGLACFRDKQEIDLRSLELFAISGPTGAGKSTLLDAMVFALYGEIPRVKSPDRTEMISAGLNRAAVVLDFLVGEKRYRIARTLRRSGSQAVRLEVRDENGTFRNLADQIRPAAEQVATILGLGAAAFTQAVVLPQGEFARFLKAQPRDRRSMLRTLLRLDVYETMREQAQRLAVARKLAVDSLLKVLADEYAGIDEAAVGSLEEEHARVAEALETARRQRDDAQEALARLRGRHAKTVELRQAEARQAALDEQVEEVERERARLEAAARALPLLPLLEEAGRAFTAATAAAKAAEGSKARQDEAEGEWRAKAAALRSAEEGAAGIPALRGQVARLHQVLGRLPERRQLRSTLERQAKNLEALDGELARLAAAVAGAQTAQKEQQAAVDAARQAAETSGYDPDLDDLLQGVRDRAVALGGSRRGAREREAELAAKRRALEEQARKVERLTQEARTARKGAEKAERAFEAAQEGVHRAVSLNEANHLREGLAPGEPCPVCEQIVATPPPAAAAPEVEAARSALEKARERRNDADAAPRQAEDALTAELAGHQAAELGVAEVESRAAELAAGVAAAEKAIRRALGRRAPHEEDGPLESWVESHISHLALSRKSSEEAKTRLAAAERALDKARADEAAARERLGEKETSRDRLAEERGESAERLATLEAEIRAVTESADPAAEAAGLEERIRRLEAGQKAASEDEAAARNRWTAAQESWRLTAQAAQAALEAALERVESRDAEIRRAGFDDEAAVRKAQIDEATAARLRGRVDQHSQDRHAAALRVAALRAELGDERVTDAELEGAEKLAAGWGAEADDLLGQEKRLEEQVAHTRRQLERSRELETKLAIEREGLRIYDLLANDLRSDRFQAYVLEEVFEELVEGASGRLLGLTGERYSLEFRNDEIRVVDHDNADETRISDTLSGGETFLTSLALALELSDQVQRAVGAVNLDSLFIDEGFGTLDPDTLALVAETLQSLRVGGRMVGIITHIPELRDEFAQQILVTKRQGFSTVEVHGLAEAA